MIARRFALRRSLLCVCRGGLLLLLLIGLSGSTLAVQDQVGDDPLTLADLDAYRKALQPDEPGSADPQPVTFADLWERPDDWLGRRVVIEGRAARRFHQGAIGEYPPLVELWIASRTGNPTCLVYPEPEGGDPTPLGGTVRFVGTYHKRVRYEAADEPRLAPLLVGPEAPELIRGPARGRWQPIGPFRQVDWLVGLIVAAAVVSVIVRQVLARPRPRRRVREAIDGPPPEFLDGPAHADAAEAREPSPDSDGRSDPDRGGPRHAP
ncbi:hypothetical protein [Tautonia marina]|uniref:hypothetical protein n=1 Tax=Tautonia marina TaxID=2653855 RepID=UPI001261269E|nr:hypothetical protein [Tautonia marina]